MKKAAAIMLGLLIALSFAGCGKDNKSPDGYRDADLPSPTAGISSQDETSQESDLNKNETPDEGSGTSWESASWMSGLEEREKTEAIKALSKVLSLEADFKMVITGADAERYDFIDTHLDKIKNIDGFKFDNYMVTDKYAIIDMDRDGSPEAVVELTDRSNSWYVVLSYHEGNVYGYSFTLRAFLALRSDGRYMASSGAAYNSILEMSFDGIRLKEKTLAHSEMAGDKVEYFVADERATEDKFNEIFNDYYNSRQPDWHLLPSDIRAGYKAERLFFADFEAVTRVVPEELEYYCSSIADYNDMQFSHESRIPQELIDLVLQAMQAGNEESLAPLVVAGTELAKEEFLRLTGFELDDTGYVFPFRIDIDNDNVEDIICQNYGGGTGGFSSMQLFRSMDGEYVLANSFECLLQEFIFLSFQGKNYLLMKNFDYNTKYFSGYNLYLYANGTLADGLGFSYKIEDYKEHIGYENDSFAGMAQIKSTLLNKRMPDILNNGGGVIFGTGEKIDKAADDAYCYSADIDNDGRFERYYKEMWYPSNMGTVMSCMYGFSNSDALEDLMMRLSDEIGEGRLYTFWLDRVGDKNVLHLYIGKNLDFSLYAYLLESTR